MKKIIVTVLLLIPLLVLYKFNQAEEYFDFEHITDDGLYVQFEDLDCSNSNDVRLQGRISLSSVRENGYNTCQRVEMKFRIFFKNRIKDIEDQNFLWEGKNCSGGNVFSENISIPIKSGVNNVCDNPMIGVKVLDYRFLSVGYRPNAIKKKSDPLGQQARFDSSIPEYYDELSKTPEYYFQSVEGLILIQKRLALNSDYSGPFDGLVNENMRKEIRLLLDSHSFYFEPVVSDASLFILGISNE